MRFGRSPSGILACLPLGEGLCMLGGLCIVQSLLAYKPGIRAGLVIGGCRPCDLAWGFAPNPIKVVYREFLDSLSRANFARLNFYTARLLAYIPVKY